MSSSSFVSAVSSGKHMVCDIKSIKNMDLLNDRKVLEDMFDMFCDKFSFTVLNKSIHEFAPQGITMLYLLSESHISIHTFPEKNYFAFDIYTCRDYKDNSVYDWIYHYLVTFFDASLEGGPLIIDRRF